MQRRVIPGKAEAVRHRFKSCDIGFRELCGPGLVGRIAIIDSASQGPGVSGLATPILILPRTGFSLVERTDRLRSFVEEEPHLWARNEQRMAIFAETTAATAQYAGWSDCSNFPVKVAIDYAKLRHKQRLGIRIGLFGTGIVGTLRPRNVELCRNHVEVRWED
jgi:hypothetical protein